MGPAEKEGLDTGWTEIAWSPQEGWPSRCRAVPSDPIIPPDTQMETHGVHCHLLTLSPTWSPMNSTLKIQQVWTTPQHSHSTEDLGLKYNCKLINVFENYTIFTAIYFLLHVMNQKELNKGKGKFLTNAQRTLPTPNPAKQPSSLWKEESYMTWATLNPASSRSTDHPSPPTLILTSLSTETSWVKTKIIQITINDSSMK